ncbi:unnamed protein product, partial [Brassica rapa subsp. trilocularis]
TARTSIDGDETKWKVCSLLRLRRQSRLLQRSHAGSPRAQLRFRLIHSWEAWNLLKKTLIGMEMLLIDEQVQWLNPC